MMVDMVGDMLVEEAVEGAMRIIKEGERGGDLFNLVRTDHSNLMGWVEERVVPVLPTRPSPNSPTSKSSLKHFLEIPLGTLLTLTLPSPGSTTIICFNETPNGVSKSSVSSNCWPFVSRMGTLSAVLCGIEGGLVASHVPDLMRLAGDVDERAKVKSRGQDKTKAFMLSEMGFSSLMSSSAGITVLDGGASCKSTTSTHTSCYVTPPLPGSGGWDVRFRVLEDTADDESTCVGLGTWPLRSDSYNSSGNLCMYRCYNGNVYQRGTQVRGGSREKVHPGDEVEVRVRGGEASVAVNGKSQGKVFSGLDENTNEGGGGKDGRRTRPVYGAVAFYGGNRKVKFVSCYGSPGPKGVGGWGVEN
ncbi:hypothetical protein TrRE_jg10215, partial [Triparma retinervis]